MTDEKKKEITEMLLRLGSPDNRYVDNLILSFVPTEVFCFETLFKEIKEKPFSVADNRRQSVAKQALLQNFIGRLDLLTIRAWSLEEDEKVSELATRFLIANECLERCFMKELFNITNPNFWSLRQKEKVASA